jgi:hypothetical protein
MKMHCGMAQALMFTWGSCFSRSDSKLLAKHIAGLPFILFIGLDGAGKTTVIHTLQQASYKQPGVLVAGRWRRAQSFLGGCIPTNCCVYRRDPSVWGFPPIGFASKWNPIDF